MALTSSKNPTFRIWTYACRRQIRPSRRQTLRHGIQRSRNSKETRFEWLQIRTQATWPESHKAGWRRNSTTWFHCFSVDPDCPRCWSGPSLYWGGKKFCILGVTTRDPRGDSTSFQNFLGVCVLVFVRFNTWTHILRSRACILAGVSPCPWGLDYLTWHEESKTV